MSNKHKNEVLVEEISAKGSEALNTLREMISKGNVRQVTFKTAAGREITTVPMSAAVVGGTLAVILGGWWIWIVAAVAYVADMKIEVTRTVEEEIEDAAEKVIRKAKSRVEVE